MKKYFLITIIFIIIVIVGCQENSQDVYNVQMTTDNQDSSAENTQNTSDSQENEPPSHVRFMSGEVDLEAISVSIINLIATPERYAGKVVRVKGISNIVFDGTAIYLSSDDLRFGFTKNAIWLDIDFEKLGVTWHDLEQFNGKPVLLEGIFDPTRNGQWGLFSGSITNVHRFEF